MPHHYLSATDPPDDSPGRAWWFAFAGNRLLVREEGQRVAIPMLGGLDALGLEPLRHQYLGLLDEEAAYSAELPADSSVPPHGFAFQTLRAIYGRVDDDIFALAGRAFQVMEWDRTHRYCGHCAAPTEPVAGERARKCPQCGLIAYPRLSPAVIVLVRRGNEALLARAHNFPDAFYSTLAGFVEPGETLEEAVKREVREEVGVELANIRYFGSQPWPFPHSLMIGFTADYAGGEIVVDGKEIADAAWFRPDEMPRIPPKLSIARRLIDDFLSSY